jgi:tetratricopeptide (TPR) repeat protein
MEPHVFVVMPFGVKEAAAAVPASANAAAKPAIEISFDEVYDLLIKPSLTKAGCIPFRADNEQGAGDIRTDMYFELVTADVILADISILNANVFYELGVRHGVAPRGVFMIHGGWSKRPFDIAPDRTFDYEGKLFAVKKEERDDAWQAKLDAQVEGLGMALRNALEVDNQTIGSPVYKELVNLQPVDWSNIQTARAKYFGEVFKDWKARVDVAKANGWPGDILTLADDAPTRFHRVSLLWEAAAALVSMQRYDVAKSVLEDLLKLDPHHRKALPQYGLVLGRLGKLEGARIHMLNVANELGGDTEAQGILGRTYKDLWKLEWQSGETLEERQKQAIQSSSYAVEAIQSYFKATRAHFDYYNGINVVSLMKLLQHLEQVTKTKAADTKINDLDGLISIVRFAGRDAVDCAKNDEAAIWATATLAELELAAGDAARAMEAYTHASHRPGTTAFQVDSMLQQVRLLESLDFRPEALTPVKELLEKRSQALAKKLAGPKKTEQKFRKVVVASGHMIDGPEREEARFPATKEPAVKERINKQLDNWKIGEGDLAISGGARGADILVAEACADRGAEVWLMLPLAEPDFLEASVRLTDSDWEDRYYNLRDRENVKLFFQPDRLKSPPKSASVFARNNLWMINTARVLADDPARLCALLVWDEKPTGDGPGGTSDFAVRIRKLGGRLAPIINPTKL